MTTNAKGWMRPYWPLGTLLLAISISSSTVVTPKQFIKSVVAFAPFPLTEEGFGQFWFDWWWLFVKGWHATEFGIVFLAIRHAMGPSRSRAAFFITAALAAGDEIHQRWVPSRGAHVSDWLIDMLGITICFLLVKFRTATPTWRPLTRIGLRAGVGLGALLLVRVLALHPF